MAQRVPRTRGGGRYTEAQYFAKIRQVIRNASQRWPPKSDVLKKASRPYKGPNKKRKLEYQCALCYNWFPKDDVEVDHFPIACGPCNSVETIGQFAMNVLCEEDNLRVLCTPCHKKETHKYGH